MTNSNTYQYQLEQDRFGLLVSAHLSDALETLPYEITERLRAARVQALGKRRVLITKTATSVFSSGGAATVTFGSEHPRWWDWAAAAAPLLLLIIGLVTINLIQYDNHINELAEIDAALLTDDLPPTAYTDPQFVLYLKMSSSQYK